MKSPVLKSLPVVMNHYVNESGWRMTLSPACFEEQCRVLAENGFRGLSLEEAEDYLLHGQSLPEKSLLFTFDDGFADNYFFALPALAAHGHQAVCFPVADRIEDQEKPRAPLDALLDGRAEIPPLARNALTRTAQNFVVRRDLFLNRGEIAAMEKSGVFRIAAHGMGHYGVFSGPDFKDFFRPKDQYRTFYRTAMTPLWGLPDFPVKPGLKALAFIPDPDLVEAVKKLVPQDFNQAAAFFAEAANVNELRALADRFKARLGRFETPCERRDRLWREIGEGKALLEQILGRKVQSLCWPWGRYCSEAFNMARDAGFKVFFTVRGGANPPGRPLAVRRFESSVQSGAAMAAQTRLHTRPLIANLLGLVGK
ncbi:polysaccharide deacetylase family protein [Desulfovibrio sp. OttesenSCG-928-G11]|nr:polysaccharide deacetylase family protein [Desulfovibrio sp. OttesenSCG-928-G11]